MVETTKIIEPLWFVVWRPPAKLPCTVHASITYIYMYDAGPIIHVLHSCTCVYDAGILITCTLLHSYVIGNYFVF